MEQVVRYVYMTCSKIREKKISKVVFVFTTYHFLIIFWRKITFSVRYVFNKSVCFFPQPVPLITYYALTEKVVDSPLFTIQSFKKTHQDISSYASSSSTPQTIFFCFSIIAADDFYNHRLRRHLFLHHHHRRLLLHHRLSSFCITAITAASLCITTAASPSASPPPAR